MIEVIKKYMSEIAIVILIILLFIIYIQHTRELALCSEILNNYILNASQCIVSSKPFNYSFY